MGDPVADLRFHLTQEFRYVFGIADFDFNISDRYIPVKASTDESAPFNLDQAAFISFVWWRIFLFDLM